MPATNKDDTLIDPYMRHSQAQAKQTANKISDAYGALTQSGADMTGRITKGFEDSGIVGGAKAVGNEIVSGINQLGGVYRDNVAKPFADVAVGKDNSTKIIDALGGAPARTQPSATARPEQQAIRQPAPPVAPNTIKRPSIAPAAEQQVGINGLIPPSVNRRANPFPHQGTDTRPSAAFVEQGNANIRARREAQGADFQNSFNDENYKPIDVGGGIADPAVSKTPYQDQLRQQELSKLQQVATTPIDNSLPYDEKKTLIRQQQAAQSALGTLTGANTADKNRTANYAANQNAAALKQQKAEADAKNKALSEKRYFSADDLFEYDLSPQEALNVSDIANTDGARLRSYFAKISPEELREDMADPDSELNKMKYGLSAERLAELFKAGHKLGGSQ